jgi:hypothetical protein
MKHKLKALLMRNLLILKAFNVALTRCKPKWNPLARMVVQGFAETLMNIIIDINLIFVLKDCLKQNKVGYK